MNEINNILNFLEDWPTDESLLSPIINSIKHGRFNNGNVIFPFCNNEEEQQFWEKHIGKYLHLYVFSLLKEWGENNSSIIKKRCISFWQRYKDSIQSENSIFLLQISSIPISIHTRIGVLMDSHLWRDNLYAPYLSALTKTSMPLFTNDLYLKYSLLLEKYLKTDIERSKEKVEKLLQYCLLIDKISRNNIPLLLNYLLILFPNAKDSTLANVISKIPFVNDRFNFVLLQYCKDNASLYGFSSEFLNRLQFSYLYNSWMNEVNNEIKKTGRPYSIELSKKTSSHKIIIKFLNSRHSIFWNKCHKIILKLVDKIAATSSTTKQNDLKIKIIERIKNLCNKEKMYIVSKIIQHVKDARHEAYSFYVNEIKDNAISKGKDIPLTEDVISSIIDTLSAIYDGSDIPAFSEKNGHDYSPFASKISSIWVKHNIFSPDEMNTVDRTSDNYNSTIKEAVTNNIWQKVREEVEDWCYNYYDQGVIHSNSDDDYNDDYDDYSSSDYYFDPIKDGLPGLVGG